MADNQFSSSESTRESELAIYDLPHKKQFLQYIFEAKWWKDYELEEGQRHRIHTDFLESLLMDFMKRKNRSIFKAALFRRVKYERSRGRGAKKVL